MNKIGIAVVVLYALVAANLLAGPGPEAPSAPEAVSAAEKAPALSLPDLSGKSVALTDFGGKVVLVDFWATWCDPCKEEIPDLVKLRDKLAPKGFELLGVSMDEEGLAAVKKFESKQKISYPVLLNNGERPPVGWTVPGLPTAYLIARDGTVVRRWFGEKEIPELEAAITAALAK